GRQHFRGRGPGERPNGLGRRGPTGTRFHPDRMDGGSHRPNPKGTNHGPPRLAGKTLRPGRPRSHPGGRMVLPPFSPAADGHRIPGPSIVSGGVLPARPGRSPRPGLGLKKRLPDPTKKRDTAQNMRYPLARNILMVQPLNSTPIMPAERMIQSTGFKPPLSTNMYPARPMIKAAY